MDTFTNAVDNVLVAAVIVIATGFGALVITALIFGTRAYKNVMYSRRRMGIELVVVKKPVTELQVYP